DVVPDAGVQVPISSEERTAENAGKRAAGANGRGQGAVAKDLLPPRARLDRDGGEGKRQLLESRLRDVPPEEQPHGRGRPDRRQRGRGQLELRVDEPVEPVEALARVERADDAPDAHADEHVDGNL